MCQIKKLIIYYKDLLCLRILHNETTMSTWLSKTATATILNIPCIFNEINSIMKEKYFVSTQLMLLLFLFLKIPHVPLSVNIRKLQTEKTESLQSCCIGETSTSNKRQAIWVSPLYKYWRYLFTENFSTFLKKIIRSTFHNAILSIQECVVSCTRPRELPTLPHPGSELWYFWVKTKE